MSRPRVGLAAPVVLAALLALPAGAGARDAYVVNAVDDDVSVIDTDTNSRRGGDIALGAGFPVEIAISPDGSRAYVLKSVLGGPGSVVVIDTANRTRLGAEIAVGTSPSGLAVSPDGSRLYVTNAGDDDVTVIDTATRARARADIPVGNTPLDVVFRSDGEVAYVAHGGTDKDVAVIDTATGQRRGSDLPSEVSSQDLGITPDGSRLYAYGGFLNLASIDVPDYPPPGGPPTPLPPPAPPTLIPGFFNGRGLAITPDGSEVFLGNSDEESSAELLSSVVTATDTRSPTDVTFAGKVYDVALDARGRFAYVTSGPEEAARAVFVVDTSTDTIVGEGIPVGVGASEIAIEPNQPPNARLIARRGAASTAVAGTFTAEVGEEIIFDASGSVDPDSAIRQRASWDYGDDVSRPGGLITRHTYGAPGTYDTLVQLTDTEGCSTRYLSTGQTAYCNGSAAARDIQRIRVIAAPELRLTARRKQRVRRPRVRASCGELPCEVTVSGKARVPRRGGKGRRSFELKQRTRSVAVGENRLIRLRFERHRKTVRKIRELLKRKRARKRNRLVVKVEATGPAGGTAKTRKRIKLKR